MSSATAQRQPNEMVLRQQRRHPFTMVPNALLCDASLKERARITYIILASKPDGWVYYEKELLTHMYSGRDALRSSLNELEQRGWIKRRQLRKGGKYAGSEIVVYDTPFDQEQDADIIENLQEEVAENTGDGKSGDGKNTTETWFHGDGPDDRNKKERNNIPPPKSPPTGGKDGPGGPGGGGYESLDQDDPPSRPCPQQRGRQSEAIRQHLHTRTKGRSRAWANPKAVDAWLDAGVPGDTIIRVVLKAEEGMDIHSWRFFERRVMAAESSYEDCENGGVIDDIRDKAHSSVVPLVEKALEMDDVQLAMDLAKTKLADGLLTFQGQNPAMLKHFAQNRVPRFRAIAQAVGIELNPRVFA